MIDDKQKKEMQGIILETIKQYAKSAAFVERKLTDVPTDDFAVVNRKYVNANGTFATRPAGAVMGQPYFATDLATNGLISRYNGNSSVWVSATGSILGAGL